MGTIRIFRLLASLTLVLALIPGLAFAQGDAPPDCGIKLDAALTWMATLQNADGGFTSGFAPESDLGATADALIAIATAGRTPDDFKKEGKTPLTFLEEQVKAGKVDNVGKLGKVVAAVVISGGDATKFGGVDLIAQTKAALEKDIDATGYLGQALAIAALREAQAEVPKSALDRLLAAKNKETGAWAFDAKQAVDTNTTAYVIYALSLTGQTSEIEAAFNYLRSIQNADKGWPYQNPSQYGTDSDANSTALIVTALVAAGQSLADFGNPQDLLKTFQQADGSFTFQLKQPAPSFLATVAAIPALCAVQEESVTPTAVPTEAK